jgi:hypothetical protein
MARMRGRFVLSLAAFFLVLSSMPAVAQEMPGEYGDVLKFLARGGDFRQSVLKVNVPRNDLHVTIAGRAAPTPFGFGGWLAMTKGEGGSEVMMGDLVLLQEEVNPVMSALLSQGIEVTALHNHFFWEEPRLYYMHIHGHGRAMELARAVKPALDLIGHVVPAIPQNTSPLPATAQGALDTAAIAKIVGHAGEQTGPVYKITLGRDDISLKEMGATINARMGLNTWAAFFGTDQDAMVAGDVAMLESEVPAVLRALRQHGLDVVAIHHHMTGARPVIIFLHYWGTGPAQKLAAGFKAALDELGKSAKSSATPQRRSPGA